MISEDRREGWWILLGSFKDFAEKREAEDWSVVPQVDGSAPDLIKNVIGLGCVYVMVKMVGVLVFWTLGQV